MKGRFNFEKFVSILKTFLASKMPEDAKVHVGNLSFDTREDDLRYEFEHYGRVEQSKGRNIVRFCEFCQLFGKLSSGF